MEDEKNLCNSCKAKLCHSCKTQFAPELGKPPTKGDVVGGILTIVSFVFLIWCVVGFAHDCGMATCGRF